MTTTQIIIVVAVIAILAGLIMARVRRPGDSETERRPVPRRDLD